MYKEDAGLTLASFRKKKNISQKELANLLHVSPSTVCKWEKGKVNIPLPYLSEICTILDLPEDLIFSVKTTKTRKRVLNILLFPFLLFLLVSILLFSMIKSFEVCSIEEEVDIYSRNIVSINILSPVDNELLLNLYIFFNKSKYNTKYVDNNAIEFTFYHSMEDYKEGNILYLYAYMTERNNNL